MKKSMFHTVLKKYGKLFIAMLLVSSLGCGLMIGMANGFLSLKNSLDHYVEEMKYPDAVITTVVTTRDVLDRILAVPGVEDADARLVGNLVVMGKDGRYLSVQAMTYDPDDFQKFYYWEKTEPGDKNPVLLELEFAAENDFKVGELITVRLGDESRECFVEGIVSRPEMLGSRQLNNVNVSNADIGFLYAPRELLKTIGNPDYEDAKAQLDEKNKEFADKESEASREREKALKEIEDAKRALEENREGFEDKFREAADAKRELLRQKKELEDAAGKIDDQEKELIEKQALLERSAKELEEARSLLSKQKGELERKRTELNATKSTLESELEKLTANLGEVKQKEAEADKIMRIVGGLSQRKELILKLKEYLRTLDLMIQRAEQIDLKEWIENEAENIGTVIAESENLALGLESFRNEISELDENLCWLEDMGLLSAEAAAGRQEVKDALAQLGIAEEQISEFVSLARAYKTNLQEIQSKMVAYAEEGAQPEKFEELKERFVAETKALLEKHPFETLMVQESFDAMLRKAGDGLNKITEFVLILSGETDLKAIREQIEDGIRQINEGLTKIQEGYEEIEGYALKIRDGEKQLKEKEEELLAYQKQLQEGFEKIRDGRKQIKDAAKQIDEAIAKIDESIEEGSELLDEAQKEIDDGYVELEDHWAKALKEFADVREELRRAQEKLDEWKGYDDFCNQFMIRVRPDADPGQILELVLEALGDVEVKNSYTYETSDVKRAMDVNVGPLETMSFYLPLFFFAVALIVGFLFMSLLIRQSRREIGILRALGFSKADILITFCSANALTMIGSIVLGSLIGLCVTLYVGSFFQNFFHLHFFHYAVHWKRFLVAAFLTILVGQMATISNFGYVSRVRPTEAMSRPVPAKVFFSKRISWLLKGCSPFVKYSIFSLLRNKLRLAFSVICIAGSVMLIFTAFSFNASKDRIQEELFGERVLYSCEIFVKEEPSEDWMKKLERSGYVTGTEKTGYYSEKLEGKETSLTANVKAVPSNTKLNGLFDADGKKIEIPEDGIILDRHLARNLNVSIGDEVVLRGIPLRVTALSEQNEWRFQFVSLATAQRLGKAGLYSVICNASKENEIPLMELLAKEEIYVYVSFTGKNRESMHKMLAPFGTCALIIILFSILIGLVTVINTFRTNLQEQKKELCILRALGHQQLELSGRLLVQAIPYLAFGCAIGLPAGVASTKFVLEKLETKNRTYPFVGSWHLYLLTVGVVLAYVVLSHFISMRSVRKWNVAENVKDKE